MDKKGGQRRKCAMGRRVKRIGDWITRKLGNCAAQAARKEEYETKITLLEKQIAELKQGIAEFEKTKEALKAENIDFGATVEQLRREDRNAQVTIRFLKDQLQARRNKKVGRQRVRRRMQASGRKRKNARLSDFI
jgi:chromosome segregation ATPase